jgi:predicted permease
VSVAVTNAVPLSAIVPGSVPIVVKGESDAGSRRRPTADINVASPHYFDTLRIPIVEGRDFRTADTTGAPLVGVVNQTMAKYWGGRSPVGADLSLDDGKTWISVVGVVGDTRQYGVGDDIVPEVFVPLSQSGGAAGRFIVRTHGDPKAFASALVDAVHRVDPDMPVKDVVTMEELRDRALEAPRLTAGLLSIFAGLALAVTLAGIGGVIAMSVTHRLREFGLRMALGATRERVLQTVIGQGLALVASGLGAGLLASLMVNRALGAYLYDTRPTDPLTLAVVCLTILVAGAAACLGPAWRATTADPLTVLKPD